MHSFTGRSIRHHFLFPALIWMSMVHGINGSSFTVNETHEFRRDLFDDATKDGIWAEYDCDSFIKDRPIYNESTWMMLRNVYHDTMGPLDSSIPLVAKTGFAVDHYIAHTDGKGRGVFTAQHIKKGQLVYAWVLHVAEFKTGPQYRRFLRSIPSDLVCETIMWSYIEDMKERAIVGYEDEHLSICLAIDDASLFNDGGKDQANLGCQSEGAEYLPFGCDFNYFALRDISQGEELLVAYASFEVEDGWKAFGL